MLKQHTDNLTTPTHIYSFSSAQNGKSYCSLRTHLFRCRTHCHCVAKCFLCYMWCETTAHITRRSNTAVYNEYRAAKVFFFPTAAICVFSITRWKLNLPVSYTNILAIIHHCLPRNHRRRRWRSIICQMECLICDCRLSLNAIPLCKKTSLAP